MVHRLILIVEHVRVGNALVKVALTSHIHHAADDTLVHGQVIVLQHLVLLGSAEAGLPSGELHIDLSLIGLELRVKRICQVRGPNLNVESLFLGRGASGWLSIGRNIVLSVPSSLVGRLSASLVRQVDILSSLVLLS